jgi:hypothetical protein
MTHYKSAENCDKLWATGGGDLDIVEAALPWLLSLPTFIAEFLCKQGGTCLRHKLLNYIRDCIDLGDFNFPADKWQLLLDWCLMASQERDGTSLLNIDSQSPALCQDQEFLEWCEHRLLSTLGPANNCEGGEEVTSTWSRGSLTTWNGASLWECIL